MTLKMRGVNLQHVCILMLDLGLEIFVDFDHSVDFVSKKQSYICK